MKFRRCPMWPIDFLGNPPESVALLAVILAALTPLAAIWVYRCFRSPIPVAVLPPTETYSSDPPTPSPCPFCGHRKTVMVPVEEHKLFRVRCSLCQAIGPFGVSPGHATHRWNDRIFRIEVSGIQEDEQ
jgi:Lar family restriction alleviation protein